MRPTTGRHSLFPRSHTHLPNSFPCELPAITETLARADNWAYRVPRKGQERVRFCLFAGSHIVRVPRVSNGASVCMPFWLKPNSAFGLLLMTTFISSSHVLTDTAQPGTPSASTLADNGTLSRACRRSKNGLRCSGGFTPDRYQSSMHR
jgi:hypothetical protein